MSFSSMRKSYSRDSTEGRTIFDSLHFWAGKCFMFVTFFFGFSGIGHLTDFSWIIELFLLVWQHEKISANWRSWLSLPLPSVLVPWLVLQNTLIVVFLLLQDKFSFLCSGSFPFMFAQAREGTRAKVSTWKGQSQVSIWLKGWLRVYCSLEHLRECTH